MSAALDVFACPLTGSTLIEASAGTGKTWAICGLALRLIAERNLPVSEVLVVTFTNAATAELKERIRDRLVETLAALDGLAAGPDPFVSTLLASLENAGLDRKTLRDRFAAALAGFDEAAIFTIHGFCQRALAEMPFAAAQPFALELTDNAELCREVAADFWRRRIAFGELPEGFAAWLTGGKLTPTLLAKLLNRHLGKPLAELRWPETGEDPPPSVSAIQAAYDQAAALWADDGVGAEQTMLAAIPTLYANIHSVEKVAEGAIAWRCFFANGDPFAELHPCALNYRCAKHKTKNKHAPPCHPFFEAVESLLAAREAMEAAFEQHRLRLLRELLDWGLAEIRRRKRERRQHSFDDLLFNVHAALHGPGGEALAAALARRYGAALIDEFQDTDPLQFAIFQRIYGGRDQPLFMVGDPKQAIYSFRQADLHTYLAARAAAGTHYTLSANQRSDAGLIAGVNRIFAANPAAFMLEGLDFEPATVGEKPRRRFADDSLPRAALQCWQLPTEALLDKAEAMQQAALSSATEIARLVNAGRAGDIQLGDRPLAAGDIAILVRTHSQGRRIKAALAEVGLAAAELSPESVFASSEAEELECILFAMLEPTRPDCLKAGLATTPMGLDADAILALADDDAALAGWVERHLDWLHAWQTRGIAEAIGRLMNETGVAGRLLAAPSGERRLTNLRHLTELLHAAESDRPTPEALLSWFATRRADPPQDEAAQLRLESDRRLVSIVTIHKAKGLQYPVVFCPFAWEGGLRRQGRQLPGLEYHADGRAVVDFGEADETGAKLEFAAEQLRLLYVALTRAEHRLYLVCGPYCKEYSGKPSTAESRKSLLNWLIAGAGATPEKWLKDGGSEAAIDAAWQAFAADQAPRIALEPLPQGQGDKVAPPASDEHLAARTAHRHLRPDWRLDSFTGLLRGAEAPESAASDHDARATLLAPLPEEPAAPVGPLDILRFPRGPQAGDCIHAVFEHVDFSDPRTWEPAIAEALAAFPPGSKLPGATLAAMLRNMLDDVLATPLPGGARLAEIGRPRRLTEMEFTLPAAKLDAQSLQATLARHGIALPTLAFRRLSGWLQGFIDLVFEAGGRYWVIDWKSNHLGERRENYAAGPLAAAMAEHGYSLQALIYQTALHRHLARRLPDYDPALHLGGALYLFVRGVRPEWNGAGIHHLPVDLSLLDDFSALLDA